MCLPAAPTTGVKRLRCMRGASDSTEPRHALTHARVTEARTQKAAVYIRTAVGEAATAATAVCARLKCSCACARHQPNYYGLSVSGLGVRVELHCARLEPGAPSSPPSTSGSSQSPATRDHATRDHAARDHAAPDSCCALHASDCPSCSASNDGHAPTVSTSVITGSENLRGTDQ